MDKRTDLYHQILEITQDYLGPAANRFVDRQITSHLNKPPQSINEKDLPVFADWAGAVIALLTEDQAVITEYTHRIKSIGRNDEAR